MEGSNTRRFPEMLLDKPVEVQIGGDTIRIENPTNNLSVGPFRAPLGSSGGRSGASADLVASSFSRLKANLQLR